jgi:hypothetical protein
VVRPVISWRAWLRDHRYKIGGAVIAVIVTFYAWVLLDIVSDNARQDTVDQAHVSDLAEVVVRLEDERRVSCAYGNELRANIREFITDLATNPAVIAKANEDFAARPCPSIPTPTTGEP